MTATQNNKMIIAFSAGILGIAALSLTGIFFLVVNAKASTTEETPVEPIVSQSAISADILAKFNSELATVLDDKHTIEMQALGEQRNLLENLTKRISSLEDQKEAITNIQSTLTTLIAQKPVSASSSVTEETPKQEPLRSINLTYAIDDSWDFSPEDIYNHLFQEHDFDPTGYSFEQMKVIHDNLHSGYPALGVMQVEQPVQYFTTRRGLFGRRFQSNAYCVGGNCN